MCKSWLFPYENSLVLRSYAVFHLFLCFFMVNLTLTFSFSTQESIDYAQICVFPVNLNSIFSFCGLELLRSFPSFGGSRRNGCFSLFTVVVASDRFIFLFGESFTWKNHIPLKWTVADVFTCSLPNVHSFWFLFTESFPLISPALPLDWACKFCYFLSTEIACP